MVGESKEYYEYMMNNMTMERGNQGTPLYSSVGYRLDNISLLSPSLLRNLNYLFIALTHTALLLVTTIGDILLQLQHKGPCDFKLRVIHPMKN